MTTTSPLNPTQDVFERVLARSVAPPSPQHGRLILIAWRAPSQGQRVVQAYVNGRWAGVSASPTDRELWLILGAGTHHEIALLAVDPADAATPSQQWIAGVDPPTRPSAAFAVLREANLPVDARLHVSLNSQPPAMTPLFPAHAPRGGFGAVFGEGGFGYDATPGPDLGLGELGYGPLGTDGTALRWQHHGLPPGDHTLELTLTDARGDALAPAIELGFTTTRLPDPPSGVALSPDLKLTWN